MTKSMRTLLVGAALAGFIAGANGAASAQDTGKTPPKNKSAKHCCKGKNECAGQGGCGADAKGNSLKGKNDCAGQGGCSTYKAGCAGKGPCKEKKPATGTGTDKKS